MLGPATLQWRMPALPRPQKITFAEMRASGVRGLLIYCSDYPLQPFDNDQRRSLADDVRLSDIERLFTCQLCGQGVPTYARISIGKKRLEAISPRSLFYLAETPPKISC
jgi:hypothetical protein